MKRVMVSYSHSARLKLYAKVKIVELEDDPTLFASLDPSDYKHRPERMMVLDVVAYDWNCPQHITPRYTTVEIEQVFDSHRRLIADREEENKRLKIEIDNLKKDHNTSFCL